MENAHNQNSHNLNDGEPVRLPSFDWDKVKFFYYIAKLKSFSEASKFLNISQSSLSRKINILEHHLKFKLFTRIPKGVELTRKGRELFDIVEQYFISLKGFTYNTVVSTSNGQKRKIRIVTTQPIAAYVLNEHLVSYTELYPNIIFEILTNDQLIDLIINEVDLAIRPYDSETKGIEQEYLFTLEKKLFASPKYLKKYGTPKSLEDLNNHRFIAYAQPEKHPYSDILWSLRLGMPANEIREPIFVSNAIECLIEAAKNGVGIFGCFEKMNIVKNSGLKNILPNVTDRSVKWYCTYLKTLKNDMEIKELINFLSTKLS